MDSLDSIIARAAEPLETAVSLPFSAYTSESVLEAERTHIFHKDWIFVCGDRELSNSGDYFAITIAGEPVVVVRGEDDVLRAFSNICRHRGTIILDEGFGTIDKYMTCPYHAWSYDTQGALKAIPHNRDIPVNREDHHLAGLRLDTWQGLVFVCFNREAPDLSERFSGAEKYLKFFEPLSFDSSGVVTFETWQCNWKLAMENAMESYHLFKVHEQTLETISPTRDAYYMAGNSAWSLTGGVTYRKKGFVEKLFGAVQDERYDHYILLSLAPSFVGVLSYGSLGWLSAYPIDATTTRIRAGVVGLRDFVGADDERDEFTDAFFQEDQDICERVQLGMTSSNAAGGKLVDMERVVVDFHQYLATRLSGGSDTPFYEDEGAKIWLK